MNDNEIKQVLNEWQVTAAPPRDFNARVWRKIEKSRSAPVSQVLAWWIEQFFSRPIVAVGYSAVALAIGLTFAQLHATRDARAVQAELQFRYIHSIDPYAKPLPQ